MTKFLKNTKGQNIVEYMLLVTIFIIFFVIFFGRNGPFRQAFTDSLNSSINFLERTATNITFDPGGP